MNDIRLRVWDGERMDHWDVTEGFNSQEYYICLESGNPFMQCTWIRDENFRGDNFLYDQDIVYCSGHGNGVISQNDWGEWCVLFKDGQEVPIHDLVMEKDLGELVGNAYANPELLK